MNRSELTALIRENFQRNSLNLQDLRIQPDPYGGWRIAVVSSDFKGKSSHDRRQIALAGTEGIHLEWVDLLTPDEKEWAGSLPLDSDLDELPLWHLALARSNSLNLEPVNFASDLEEDLELPIKVTFYSYKGGVGRTTALAYTGMILASRGWQVLCVDMDLEAPGLASVFGKEKEIEKGKGVVAILREIDSGNTPYLREHLIRVSDGDELYCLPAGVINADYARQLGSIDPASWYREEENPMRGFLHLLEGDSDFSPDVILFDARTGIAQINGPLLFDLSDVAVITFFPHPQVKEGTELLVKALFSTHTQRLMDHQKLNPEPRFLISPVPQSRASQIIELYRNRPLEWIDNWLMEINHHRTEGNKILSGDISHAIPYQEVIATADTILQDKETWKYYEPIADWMERFLPKPDEPDIPSFLASIKPQILNEIKFSSGTAEEQEDFLQTFIETDVVVKALQPQNILVLGRKGSGKTAIFRRILEDPGKSSIVVNGYAELKNSRPWMLGVAGLRSIAKQRSSERINWDQFWPLYICIAACHETRDLEIKKQLSSFLNDHLGALPYNENETITFIENVIGDPKASITAIDFLNLADGYCRPNTFMLFDGLDTGFGSTEDDRKTRAEAIEGLFTFVTDQSSRFKNLVFKIILREDIWKKLRFENKSHLLGRSVSLQWKQQSSYLRVILKRALLSPTFADIMRRISNTIASDLSTMDDKMISSIWNVLIGERMKGGKTAFTGNWVWSRLCDTNNDRNPRTLLQLFHMAKKWETENHSNSPYEKSIIRPRALIESLPKVSEEALDAIKQEFPELGELIESLRTIGRTPFESSCIENYETSIKLALEIGLLGVYEGTEDSVQKYKVPEIYRHALTMTRKGQF